MDLSGVDDLCFSISQSNGSFADGIWHSQRASKITTRTRWQNSHLDIAARANYPICNLVDRSIATARNNKFSTRPGLALSYCYGVLGPLGKLNTKWPEMSSKLRCVRCPIVLGRARGRSRIYDDQRKRDVGWGSIKRFFGQVRVPPFGGDNKLWSIFADSQKAKHTPRMRTQDISREQPAMGTKVSPLS